MIRHVEENELNICVKIIRKSFLTVAMEFGFTEENAPRFTAFATNIERLKAQYLDGRPMFVYVNDENNIVGYYSLLIQGKECELNNLCVLPQFRHREIGEELLAHACRQAEKAGCNRMNIGIVEENVKLRKWYEKYGAVHTGTKKFDFFPFTCGYLVKELPGLQYELVNSIREQTEVMFHNLMVSMKTCEWDCLICGTPAWRYMYHTLHSCDRWYINPAVYKEPEIHAENLDKVDLPCEKILTKEELWEYFYQVKNKIMNYLDSLTDEDLYKKPRNYQRIRMDIILGQIRHFCVHIGIFNGITISNKNKYPMVIGLSQAEFGEYRDKLYDE